MIRIGMAQIMVIPEDRDKNLESIAHYVEEASGKNCDIVVLPECSDLGWANPYAREQAEPIPGNSSDLLCGLAQKRGIHIACGITEREGDALYNSALLIDDKGEILLKYRKINLLTGIEDMYCVGNRVQVADTKFGKIGISICADNLTDSDVIGHVLGRMGCQLLLSPSSWAVPEEFLKSGKAYGEEWKVPYRILSKTYKMPIVGVSNVGEVPFGVWKGWCCIGNSIATDSKGEIVRILPFGRRAETLEVLELELEKNELQGTALARETAGRRK